MFDTYFLAVVLFVAYYLLFDFVFSSKASLESKELVENNSCVDCSESFDPYGEKVNEFDDEIFENALPKEAFEFGKDSVITPSEDSQDDGEIVTVKNPEIVTKEVHQEDLPWTEEFDSSVQGKKDVSSQEIKTELKEEKTSQEVTVPQLAKMVNNIPTVEELVFGVDLKNLNLKQLKKLAQHLEVKLSAGRKKKNKKTLQDEIKSLISGMTTEEQTKVNHFVEALA